MHDTHGGTKGTGFVPPEERKTAGWSNCSLLLSEVRLQRQQSQTSEKKCTSQDKRLQS